MTETKLSQIEDRLRPKIDEGIVLSVERLFGGYGREYRNHHMIIVGGTPADFGKYAAEIIDELSDIDPAPSIFQRHGD